MIQRWIDGGYERSQASLARAAGIPATTVRNILAGKGATADTISKLRRVRGLGGLQPEHFTNGDAK